MIFSNNLKNILRNIKAILFDVDGVLTDGTIYLFSTEEFTRRMSIKDGYAIQYCIKQGIPIGIISGGNSDIMRKRFNLLGVTDLYFKSTTKIYDYQDFKFKYQLNDYEIAYMGDDIPDYEIMKLVGLPACPADAVDEIKEISKYISPRKGGEGCARDLIEIILKAQNKWMNNNAFEW